MDGEGENLALFSLFHVVESAFAPVLNRMGFRVDACGDSQGTANGGKEHLLGEVRAKANFQQGGWNGDQGAVFAAVVGGDVLQNPIPKLLRISGKGCFLLCGESLLDTLTPSGQLFGIDARGENIGNIDFFRQIALRRSRSHVLLQYIGAQVGHVLDGQYMQELCAQLHLGSIGSSSEELLYRFRIAFGVKEGFGCVVSTNTAKPKRFCRFGSRSLGVEGRFLLVQQGSGGVKALLLTRLLLVGQANSKFHVVLWWNNVVFFTLQLFSLGGAGSGEINGDRRFLAGIHQTGNKFSILDRVDMQVAQAQCDGGFSVFIRNQG